MPSIESKQKQKSLIEQQYTHGETLGPRWYQFLKPFVKNREQVAITELRKIAVNTPLDILELGCGEGSFLLQAAVMGHRVTGLDLLESRLQIARKIAKAKEISNVTFRAFDLNDPLPIADNSFDVVVSLSVIEYVFDPYAFIAEANRVLKQGGVFIIEVPNIAYLPERVALLLGLLPSWPKAPGWQGGRLHSFTVKTLKQALHGSGFTVSQIQGIGFLQPLRRWWPSLLSGEILVVAKKK